MFKKIMIANRGEIAKRVIRAIHEVGAQAVAVYSTVDAGMPYLAEADEAICIGPGPAASSYLNQDAILQAALQSGCAAIHPGFGFLAENALFATRCEQQKLTFIGPRPRQIVLMGDKARARSEMAAAGLAVTTGSKGVLSSWQEAIDEAQKIGYPVLLKASAGGGGKGMRLVNAKNEMQSAYSQASNEAEKAFGNGLLYVEKFLEGARHIEWQMLADKYGKVVCLGERECSIQRQHQKLLEEAPARGISQDDRKLTSAQLCSALVAIGYQGAGTVEFLLDSGGKMYFMEMNTRLQVEHPVTELVTHVDIVKWQLRIAAGEALAPELADIVPVGHAIECRINAEDPQHGFRPSPGRVEEFEVPANHWNGPLRIDSHMASGVTISPFYDSMVAKIIAWGPTRSEALELMKKSLENCTIKGVATTLPLHKKILSNKQFIQGGYNCSFIARQVANLGLEDN